MSSSSHYRFVGSVVTIVVAGFILSSSFSIYYRHDFSGYAAATRSFDFVPAMCTYASSFTAECDKESPDIDLVNSARYQRSVRYQRSDPPKCTTCIATVFVDMDRTREYTLYSTPSHIPISPEECSSFLNSATLHPFTLSNFTLPCLVSPDPDYLDALLNPHTSASVSMMRRNALLVCDVLFTSIIVLFVLCFMIYKQRKSRNAYQNDHTDQQINHTGQVTKRIDLPDPEAKCNTPVKPPVVADTYIPIYPTTADFPTAVNSAIDSDTVNHNCKITIDACTHETSI
jgi:hypothetical protein